MPRPTIGLLMIGVAVSAVALATYKATYRTISVITSHPGQIDKIEALNNPRVVQSWDVKGLILTDGSRVTLPGIVEIPADSKALKIGMVRGIEVTPEGRVIGLVRVHHWRMCGSSPYINQLARVDLSDLMTLLGEDSQATSPPITRVPISAGGAHWHATSRTSYDDGLDSMDYDDLNKPGGLSGPAISPLSDETNLPKMGTEDDGRNG
jgi:hypothetical protein